MLLQSTGDSILKFVGYGEERDHGFDRRCKGREWVRTGVYYVTRQDGPYQLLYKVKPNKPPILLDSNY